MLLDWDWLISNQDYLWVLFQRHMILSLTPVIIGVIIAVPLGIFCVRWPWLYRPVLVLSTGVFAIPSLAFFMFLIPFTGLSDLTAIIPLATYTVSLLVRNVVEGISSTDETIRQAASAMGFSRIQQLLNVELPIATPLIIGGLRVAVVAIIGMVSLASVMGISNLGDLFIDGAQRFFATPILVGIILTVIVAGTIDLLLLAFQNYLTPWAQRRNS